MGSGRLNLESYASNFVPLWCGMLPPGQSLSPKSCVWLRAGLSLNFANVAVYLLLVKQAKVVYISWKTGNQKILLYAVESSR